MWKQGYKRYAKTLYKPEFPKEISEQIKEFTNKKLPAFFEYAKDKKVSDDKNKTQVEKRNGSFVNKLYDVIPNKSINTRGLQLGKLDYHKMMSNVNTTCKKEVSDLYDELNKKYRYKINMKDEYIDNLRYVACQIRDEFSKFGYSNEELTDMLVKYLYGNNKRSKQLFWFCYGQYVVKNLESNIPIKKTKFIQCVDCGEWFEVDINNVKTCRCEECNLTHNRELRRLQTQRYRQNKRM